MEWSLVSLLSKPTENTLTDILNGILTNLFKAISLNETCVLVINHEYHEVQFVPQG